MGFCENVFELDTIIVSLFACVDLLRHDAMGDAETEGGGQFYAGYKTDQTGSGCGGRIAEKAEAKYSLSPLLAVDERRRALITESGAVKSKAECGFKKIPQLKKEGKDTSQLLEEMKESSEQVII